MRYKDVWPDPLYHVMEDIVHERLRQDEKWGIQEHSVMKWSTILGEEFGEACKEALEFDQPYVDDENISKLRAELVQVAAVAAAWIEHLDRGTCWCGMPKGHDESHILTGKHKLEFDL
jgi:hypothetical protein